MPSRIEFVVDLTFYRRKKEELQRNIANKKNSKNSESVKRLQKKLEEIQDIVRQAQLLKRKIGALEASLKS